MKPHVMGKPKEPLTTEQRQQAATLSAAGWSQNKISKNISRSRGAVKHYLDTPEAAAIVQDEKAVLAGIYRSKARRIVESINEEDISKASLQQKSISSGVLLDKSLLLTGDVPTIRIEILLAAVQEIRDQRVQDGLAARTRNPQLPAGIA